MPWDRLQHHFPAGPPLAAACLHQANETAYGSPSRNEQGRKLWDPPTEIEFPSAPPVVCPGG